MTGGGVQLLASLFRLVEGTCGDKTLSSGKFLGARVLQFMRIDTQRFSGG